MVLGGGGASYYLITRGRREMMRMWRGGGYDFTKGGGRGGGRGEIMAIMKSIIFVIPRPPIPCGLSPTPQSTQTGALRRLGNGSGTERENTTINVIVMAATAALLLCTPPSNRRSTKQ